MATPTVVRDLEGKVALVVGGGSGMGRAGAVAMAAEGARVAVADIALERAEVVAASCGGLAVVVDVCDTASVERMVDVTVERFGRLDVVYHCAVDVPFVNTQDRRVTELDEAVWNNAGNATGGGVSQYYPVPSWQRRVRVPQSRNRGRHRGRGPWIEEERWSPWTELTFPSSSCVEGWGRGYERQPNGCPSPSSTSVSGPSCGTS